MFCERINQAITVYHVSIIVRDVIVYLCQKNGGRGQPLQSWHHQIIHYLSMADTTNTRLAWHPRRFHPSA
jgi:hypothetical protein